MGALTQQQLLPLLALLSLAMCLLTLVNTRFGLSVLIFAMLLSPELEIFQVPERSVVIRAEDFLIGTVFITWLAKIAIVKELYLFRGTPLNAPILLYIALCVFSTLLGMIRGSVHGFSSFFFILKYLEYFILFFMFVNNIQSKKDIQQFLTFFLITAFCVCLISLSQYGKVPRLTAPFEGKNPEPASLGGYLLVVISFVLGCLSYVEWPKQRWILWPLLLLLLATLVLSTSRGGLISFVPMYLFAVLLSSHRRKILILFILMLLVVGTPLVPQRVTSFFKAGFSGEVYQVRGYQVEVGPTGAERVEAWKYLLKRLQHRALLGLGVTGAGLVDNQHLRVLGETGIIGLTVFVWLLVRIFRVGFVSLKEGPDNLSKALGMSLICSNAALIVFGVVANTFIVVRIMEPFWFLAAVTFSISQFKREPLPA